jgi:hypothetical protein
VDALLVNRNYIRLYRFPDPLLKLAGDVNIDNRLNPVDALLINRRYIKVINSFKAGDWLNQKDVITVNSDKVTKDIKAVCTGDVNGTYYTK